jgi:hypothetical protein
MTKAKPIPEDVKQRVIEIVERFNNQDLKDAPMKYAARFSGRHLYLDRCDYGNTGSICRLKYTGDFEKWEFAIFKYSSETYDADEWMFPGAGDVDGTIEGAMRAGLQAYPA